MGLEVVMALWVLLAQTTHCNVGRRHVARLLVQAWLKSLSARLQHGKPVKDCASRCKGLVRGWSGCQPSPA